MSLDKTLLTLTALRDGLERLVYLMQHELISLGCDEMLHARSINSLFINAWPTRSFAIQNAAGFHKIFKLSLNSVSVRRVLSKLISKFTLYCSW